MDIIHEIFGRIHMTEDPFYKQVLSHIAGLTHRLEKANEHIEELESLVEYAFREGVRAGLSDVPGYRTWEESDSYRKLKGEDT